MTDEQKLLKLLNEVEDMLDGKTEPNNDYIATVVAIAIMKCLVMPQKAAETTQEKRV